MPSRWNLSNLTRIVFLSGGNFYLFLNLYRHVDYLILNAAVFALPYSVTKDNVETTFQVCHLSHFYMTLELEPLLNHMSRVVVVSSESHRFSSLPCELTEPALSPMPSKFWSMAAYNNVKLCNVLFARELGRVSIFFFFIYDSTFFSHVALAEQRNCNVFFASG